MEKQIVGAVAVLSALLQGDSPDQEAIKRARQVLHNSSVDEVLEEARRQGKLLRSRDN